MWKFLKAMFSRRQFLEPGGYREIWRIAWPLIILSASNTIMMVTNRAFLAHSSAAEIAAAMPAGQMYFTLMAFFLITTGFTATIVAQFHGANDPPGCVRASWNGFYFGSAMAALLAIALPAGGKWILLHNGHDPLIAQYEVQYFLGMVPCAGLVCMETAFLSFFTGRGKTTFVAAIKIIGCLISVPLNYVLIFGKGGLPPLGILGAGIANSTATLFTFLISLGCFLLANQKEYPTRQFRSFDLDSIKKLLFFGTPAGFQTFLRNAAFAIVLMMIGYLGKEELTATSIALSINMIGNMPMIGIMDATSVITGRYIGQRRLLVAERICGRSIRMLLIWVVFAAAFYLLAPELLIKLFGAGRGGDSYGMDMERVFSMVKVILLLAIAFNILDAVRFIVMGSLRGAGDTQIPLLIGLGTSWLIQIPGTLLLIYVLRADIALVWLWITFYIGVDAGLMVWRRRSGAWKRIKLIDIEPVSRQEELREHPEDASV